MTDRAQVYQLEQLYLAVTSPAGRDAGAQVLARTPGIRPEHVVECRRVAMLLPPPGAQPDQAMPGVLGLFRGETIDYVIARAAQRAGGPPIVHYLLAPSAMMRRLGGNLRLLEPYALEPFPHFSGPRADLEPFVMQDLAAPDEAMQTDDLLTLLGYCKHAIRTVEGLLAGLVQGLGLGIVNAPPSLHDRLTFVQGLLSLLPAPARVAITFATHVSDPVQTNTQIKFLAAEVPLERHLIFDWATGKLRNEAPEDTYTRFIIAQLRLDTSLVVAETEKLARTAVWRAMRRENMANALAWASRRASLDSAVREGLPADREMVAAVLREDPTLPDDLRIVYSRHLLAMALAIGDPANTDIIPAIAVQNKELADTIYQQLWAAAGGEHAMAAYRIVEYWVAQAPMGVDVSRWRPLLGMAAMARATALLTGDSAGLVKFLNEFLEKPPALQLENVAAQIIGLCRKRSYDNPAIAQALFLLAATYLPTSGLQRLLADSQFVYQLPGALRGVFPFLAPDVRDPAPPGMLARAAEVFGVERRPIILGRLVEWSLFARRLDLIDTAALQDMVQAAVSPYGERFDTLIQHIVQDLSHLNILRAIGPKAQRYLVELSLARKRYDEAVTQLTFYQDMLYPSAGQEQLAEIIRSAFREVPLQARPLLQALEVVHESKLKPLFCANADIGALEGKKWQPTMELAMRHLTGLVFAEPRLIALLRIEPILRLLKANADRRDVVEALRVAGAIVAYALMFDEHGPELINQVYALVNWNPAVSAQALEVIRNYVRRAPLEHAAALSRLLGSKHGAAIQTTLEATFRIRLFVGGTDLAAFAERVQVTTRLLLDIATFYREAKDIPTVLKLRRSVDSMPGGLTEAEGKRLSANLITMGAQILKLYGFHQARYPKRNRSEADARRLALTKGKAAPTTAIEALTWLGGQLGQGHEVALDWGRETTQYMMGTRSVNVLLRESEQVVQLFSGLLAAFPENALEEVDRHVWAAEVDSLWALLTLYTQRVIHEPLVQHLQYLAQLLVEIGERGNERSLQPTGYGRQLHTGRAQPRTVLDVLRWLSGYFAREHVRHSTQQ